MQLRYFMALKQAETLEPEEKQLLEQLCNQSELSEAIRLSQRFIALVRGRLPDALDSWLETANNSTIKAFQSFAKGLIDDYDAVKAGVTLEYN